MRYLMALIVPLVLLAVYNAQADSDDPGSDALGRYMMERTDEGYIRLDTQTGVMSLCHRKNAGWACEVIPDDRVAPEEELRRLDDELKTLREQAARLSESETGSPDGDKNRVVIELPTKKDILEGVERAGEFMDDVMERFQIMMQAMKDELNERT